jgi:Cys-tRNA(Pro) deacylase
MAKEKEPVTAAVRVLRAAGVSFDGHLYPYVTGGGTAQVARELEVYEHSVVNTLILEDERESPLVMLMHGDQQVSLRELARQIGVRHVEPCAPAVADRHSGYQVGGTSPFGTRRGMPVYCEASIAALPRIYINGGKRGYIVALATEDLLRVLNPVLVEASQP